MDRHQLAAWLQEKLFERRIVLITGIIDDMLAAQVTAQLTTLDAASDAPIEIHLDSPDGTLEAAFVIIDAMDAVRAPVRAYCRGRVGGPAIGVLAAASQRVSAPHARFRLGQPAARFTGTPDFFSRRSMRRIACRNNVTRPDCE